MNYFVENKFFLSMEEWKTYKLGDLCRRVCSGGTPKSNCEEYYGGDIPWLNTKEINFNRIYSTEANITQSGLEKLFSQMGGHEFNHSSNVWQYSW